MQARPPVKLSLCLRGQLLLNEGFGQLARAVWPEVVGTVAGDDTIFVALALQPRAYGGFAQRLARLGAYVQPED